MVTEVIDIRVRERGTRTVRRRLESIGDVAVRSTRSLRLMQNALFVLGAAGTIRSLQRTIDRLTSFENRLRIVTDSTRELNAVQAELFQLARSTRAGFDSVAETYSRTALSVRFLGLSQREVLEFTESLTQAAILSGASVRETNAALVQLGQGLASNRLSGDELRSVLEQLPFVADIIAQQLETTRGGLRALAKEGRVTTQVILDAFTNARDEIQAAFASITPTIEQAFNVFSASVLELIDGFDDITTASASISAAIITLSSALDEIAGVTLGVAAAFATLFAGRALGAFITSLALARERARSFAAAVSAGDVVLLRSADIERAKATTSLQAAAATQASTGATLAEAQAERARLAQKLLNIMAARAELEFTVQGGIARNVATGQIVNQARAERLLAVNQRATAHIQGLLNASTISLNSARSAYAAATTAATAAEARYVAAVAASTTLTNRLARAFPTLSFLITDVTNKFTALGAVARAHPYLALATAIAGVGTALFALGDNIEIAQELETFNDTIQIGLANLGDDFAGLSSATVTLRDVMIASFQLLQEEVLAISSTIGRVLRDLIGEDVIRVVQESFNNVLGVLRSSALFFIRDIPNLIIGTFQFLLGVTRRIFGDFENIFHNTSASIGNFFAATFADIILSIADFLETISSIGGESLFDPIIASLRDFQQEVRLTEQTIRGEGNTFLDILEQELERSLIDEDGRIVDHLGNQFDAIFERALEIARQRQENLNQEREARRDTSFDTYIEQLERELRLRNQVGLAGEIGNAMLKAERVLKRQLVDDEAQRLQNLIVENAIRQGLNEALQEGNAAFHDAEAALQTLTEQQIKAEASLLAYVDGLEREAELLKFVGLEREIQATILEHQNRLERNLTRTERQRIRNLIVGNAATKEARQVQQAHNQALLDAERELDRMTEAQRRAEEGHRSFIASLEREAHLLQFVGLEREVQAAILSEQDRLERNLSTAEAQRIRNLIVGNAETRNARAVQQGFNQALLDAERALDQMTAAQLRAELGLFSYIDGLEREGHLLQFVGLERQVQTAILARQDEVERNLTRRERARIRTLIISNEATRQANAVALQHNQALLEAEQALERMTRSQEDAEIGFRTYLDQLERERDLLFLARLDREVQAAILSQEDRVRRNLTQGERLLIEALIDSHRELRRQQDILEGLRGPLQTYQQQLFSLEALLATGKITVDEFTRAVQRLQIQFAQSGTDNEAGLARGFLTILEQAGDFASQLERVITSAYDGIAEGLTDLVLEGKISFRSLVDDLLRQLVRLAINKTFIALFSGTSFGNFLGLPGAGPAGGGTLAPVNPGPRQFGGSFRVPGQGAPDTRLVQFLASPGERVTVEPVGKQDRGEVRVEVHNYGREEVQTEVGSGPSGERVLRVLVGKTLAEMARDGSLDPVMGQYGGSRRLVQRG